MQDIYGNTYDAIFLVFPIYNFGINSLMQKFLERRYAYLSSQKIGAVVLHGSKEEIDSGVDIFCILEDIACGTNAFVTGSAVCVKYPV